MCVRHAYQCEKCNVIFEIPLGQSWIHSALCWLTIGTDARQHYQDMLCDNKFCQRKTEGGYRVCLNMQDPCYFCIRFGHADQCYTAYLPALCCQCSEDKHFKLPHYRRVRQANNIDSLFGMPANENK